MVVDNAGEPAVHTDSCYTGRLDDSAAFDPSKLKNLLAERHTSRQLGLRFRGGKCAAISWCAKAGFFRCRS